MISIQSKISQEQLGFPNDAKTFEELECNVGGRNSTYINWLSTVPMLVIEKNFKAVENYRLYFQRIFSA